MNNIKPKYIPNSVKEFGKRFVTGITRPDADTLKVSFEKGKYLKLKPTDINFMKSENRIKEQSAYQYTEVLPAIKRDATIDIIGTIVLLGMTAITQFMTLPISEQITKVVHYVMGSLSAIGFVLSADDIIKISNIIKRQFFFDNRELLNEGVEKSDNMLNGTSFVTKRAIKKGKDINAISVMNLKWISKRDLKVIRDNIQIQKDLEFELHNPIKRKISKRK